MNQMNDSTYLLCFSSSLPSWPCGYKCLLMEWLWLQTQRNGNKVISPAQTHVQVGNEQGQLSAASGLDWRNSGVPLSPRGFLHWDILMTKPVWWAGNNKHQFSSTKIKMACSQLSINHRNWSNESRGNWNSRKVPKLFFSKWQQASSFSEASRPILI